MSAYRYYLRGWLNPKERSRWLDLGCGQGHLMRLAKSIGYPWVEGIDASPEMVAIARKGDLFVRQADVLRALDSLVEGSFSVISCFDLLEHFPKETGFALLQKINRALYPGGILLLKLPNAYSPWGMGITANDLTHEVAYTEATIRQLGRLAGFQISEVREIGPVPNSFTGMVRFTLWRSLRLILQGWDMIETGHPRTRIYTRVMLCRLEKQQRDDENDRTPDK